MSDSLEQLFEELLPLGRSERERLLALIHMRDAALADRLRALLHEDTSLDVGATVSGAFADLKNFTQDAIAHAPGGVSRLFAPGTVVGGFTIVRLIGSGGAGWVFEARQKQPARSVALKILRSDLATERLRRRFELEAEHLAIVDHPCIASIYASGTDSATSSPWIATEFVVGARSIAEYAKELPPRSRVRLLRDACLAVASAHDKGVLHRDLKPTNILVSQAAQVKVIDFGLARLVDTSRDNATLGAATEAGEILGTLFYMSPEQCRGDNKSVDVRSDVFSLGAVLYELLAERLPREFVGQTIHGALRQVAEQPIPRLRDVKPDISADYDAIVAMACADDPMARYASASEFAADLQRAMEGEPIRARVPSVARRLRSWARRHPALATVCAASIVVFPTLAASAIFIALDARTDRLRAEGITARVVEQLVPAVKKLGMTQDAPAVREIEFAAYELSVLVNGENSEASALLAHKLALDWLKGMGRDHVKALAWAERAEAHANASIGADSRTSIEARCVQAAALQRFEDPASLAKARAMLVQLADIVETRDEIDTTSGCLSALGEYADADGDHAKALEYFERAVQRSTRIAGPDTQSTVEARSYRVDVYNKQLRFDLALQELDALLAIQYAQAREHKPWTLLFELQRGQALWKLERMPEAEAQLIRAEGLIRDYIGANAPMRNKARVVLRDFFNAQGRTDEATAWADVAVAG
ncbi:MAG: serine/threonine protein kinase [Phycisphaerales bacterium]|nr:serine/threonine protein kinase [Phycisphaerales bacterium]